jgi:hypothetical protein
MLVIGAFLVAQSVAFTPGSTVALAAGLFPFTAPLVQPLRMAAGAAQPWEVVAAVVLTGATIALLVPLAARLYSGGCCGWTASCACARLGARGAVRHPRVGECRPRGNGATCGGRVAAACRMGPAIRPPGGRGARHQ